MDIANELQIENILKSLREQIGEQAQVIAVLKATIEAITKAKETPVTTTAVPLIPNVEGTKGI
jgi:hypothetical protein